jgi:hypothetical protein
MDEEKLAEILCQAWSGNHQTWHCHVNLVLWENLTAADKSDWIAAARAAIEHIEHGAS